MEAVAPEIAPERESGNVRGLPGDVSRRIADRYRFSRHLHHYAWWKLRLDPVYPAVAAHLADSAEALLDVGCGIGLLTAVLRETGCARAVTGIDRDARKIAHACRALPECADAFAIGDAGLPLAFRGDVAALDVLHYLPAADRAEALRGWVACLPANGRLILRTAFADGGWVGRVTALEEWFIRASGWISHGAGEPLSREWLHSTLRASGCAVTTTPLPGVLPVSSHLVVARRLPT